MKYPWLPAVALFAVSPSFSALVEDCVAGEQYQKVNVLCAQHYMPLMLAQNYAGQAVQNWLMSEKLDGVRAFWTKQNLISRQGRVINAPAEFLKDFPPFTLDGELWQGRGMFEQTVGQVRRGDFEGVGFYVFDVPEASGNLMQRLQVLQDWLAKHPNPHIHIIPHKPMKDITVAHRYLEEVSQQGGEGVMLRHPEVGYQYGRSKDMLKLKLLFDDECTVVAHIQGKGKYAHALGALVCRLKNGKFIRIGSGFSDNERQNPPPIGSIVTFHYNGYTKKGTPRFPRFYRMFTQP